jgi:hypothetical protein
MRNIFALWFLIFSLFGGERVSTDRKVQSSDRAGESDRERRKRTPWNPQHHGKRSSSKLLQQLQPKRMAFLREAQASRPKHWLFMCVYVDGSG